MNKLEKKIRKLVFLILCDGKDIFSFMAGMIISGYVVGISMRPNNNYLHWIVLIIGLLIGYLLFHLIKLCGKVEVEEINLKKDQRHNYERTVENIEQILQCVTNEIDEKKYTKPIKQTFIILMLILFLFGLGIITYNCAEGNANDKLNNQAILNAIEKRDCLVNEIRREIDSNFEIIKRQNLQQCKMDSVLNSKMDAIIEKSKVIEMQTKRKTNKPPQ